MSVHSRGKSYTVDTKNSTPHLALVVYPWVNEFPLEGEDNSKTKDRKILSTSNTDTSFKGITSVQVSRRKSAGGTMMIDCMGFLDPDFAQIGAWCFLATSTTKPLKTIEDIQNFGIVKFFGQIYNVNGQHFADADGNIRKTIKVTVREWSHILHAPVRYHPAAMEANVETGNKLKILQKKLAEQHKAGALAEQLASAFFTVFQLPGIVFSYLDLLSDEEKSVFGADLGIEDLSTLFKNTVSRLPILPQKLLKDLFPDDQGMTPDNCWSAGAVTVLSGVQKWKGKTNNGVIDTDILKGTNSSIIDSNAERPLARFNFDAFVMGGTFIEQINDIVSGNAASEFYTDMLYVDKNGRKEARPFVGIRDIPYSLRIAGESGNFQWTYFDDLPRAKVSPTSVISISLTRGFDNTANFIEVRPVTGDFTQAQYQAAVLYYGTTVLPENQKRFGGQKRSTVVRDIWNYNRKPPEGDDEIKSKSYEENLNSVVKSNFDFGVTFDWYKELADKHIQWFSADYLFPNIAISMKDDDIYLTCGHNVELQLSNDRPKIVGHLESIQLQYNIEEGGRVSTRNTIHLSRCGVDVNGQVEPMPTRMVTDLPNVFEFDPYSPSKTMPPRKEISPYLNALSSRDSDIVVAQASMALKSKQASKDVLKARLDSLKEQKNNLDTTGTTDDRIEKLITELEKQLGG